MRASPVLAILLALASPAAAEPLDRVAIVVGSDAVTLSAVTERARGKPLDATAAQMVEDLLVAHVASQLHVDVTPDEIERAISAVARMNNLDVPAVYAAARDQGWSEPQYRAELRRQLLTAKVLNVVAGPSLHLPPNASDAARNAALDAARTRWLDGERKKTFVELRLAPPPPPPAAPVVVCSSDKSGVTRVELRGAARVGQKLCGALQVRAGAPLDRMRVRSDVEGLWRTDLVDDVRVDRSAAGASETLIYTVVERPTLAEIAWGANDLLRNNVDDGPAVGEVLSRPRLQREVEALRQAWRERGYLRAQVTVDVRPAAPGTVRIVYAATPGPLARVTALELRGARVVPQKELLELLGGGDSPTTVGGVYHPDALESALAVLQARLYDAGLIQGRVDAPTVVESADGTGVTITIALEEGDVYRLGRITFRGKLAGDASLYQAAFGLKNGVVFSRSSLLEARRRLQELHERRGGQGRFDVLTDIDPKAKLVHLTWEIGD